MLRNWFAPRRRPITSSRSRSRHRLGSFDRLEDRTVPAVLTVTSLADTGPGTLRAAVQQANVAPDADSIVFAPALAGGTVTLTSGSDGTLGRSALTISTPITIYGTVQTLARFGIAPLRLFLVAGLGSLTLHNLALSNGLAEGSPGGAGGGGGGGLGGAVFTLGGNLNAADCTFSADIAEGAGPAVAGNPGFRGAGVGAAVFNLDGLVAMTATTVSGNSHATTSNGAAGGAVYNLALNAAVQGLGTTATTTLVDDILANTTGGPDRFSNRIDGTATVTATAPNIVRTQATLGHSIINGTGISTADPLLGPLADNGGPTRTMSLLPNSPALNAGTATGATPLGVTTDQRGATRDDPPDLGAYEVQHPLSPVGVPVESSLLFAPHPSASQTEAYVKALYNATLLRQGSSSEVAASVNLLNTGAATRAQLAYDFYNSPENRGNQVRFFYRYFLGRDAAQFEIDNSVHLLQGGLDEGVLMSQFFLSPEYAGQNTNTQFANTMYYAILGRPAAQFEIDNAVNQLVSNQATRAQVVQEFLRSPESIGRVVRSDYVAYLKRPATDAELNAALAQVQGGATFGSVAITLLGGDEMFTAAGAHTA
jgi:hypothetical protein